MKETLLKQIETYSIGIVAFIVLQGVTFSYYFGASEFFNCRVHTSELLAEVLTFLFVVVTVLSLIAIRYIGLRKAELCPEYDKIFKNITMGKIIIVFIFGIFPAFLIFYYSVIREVPKSCENLVV